MKKYLKNIINETILKRAPGIFKSALQDHVQKALLEIKDLSSPGFARAADESYIDPEDAAEMTKFIKNCYDVINRSFHEKEALQELRKIKRSIDSENDRRAYDYIKIIIKDAAEDASEADKTLCKGLAVLRAGI